MYLRVESSLDGVPDRCTPNVSYVRANGYAWPSYGYILTDHGSLNAFLLVGRRRGM